MGRYGVNTPYAIFVKPNAFGATQSGNAKQLAVRLPEQDALLIKPIGQQQAALVQVATDKNRPMQLRCKFDRCVLRPLIYIHLLKRQSKTN